MPGLARRGAPRWARWWARLRWLALVGAWLLVLGHSGSTLASTPPECLAAGAIAELEPSERTRLQQMCEGSPSPNGTPLSTRDRATLAAGLRLEGWRAAFAARALATVEPPSEEHATQQAEREAWFAQQLARTRTQRGKEVPACQTLRDLVTNAVRDLGAGRAPIPPSVQDLAADGDCVPKAEQDQLDQLDRSVRLLTVPRRAKDVIEAHSVSLDGLEVLRVEPIPLDGDEPAWLLLLPKDRMVTLSVQQPDLDVPWIETRRMVDIDFTLPRRKGECVIIEAGTDPDADWSVVVNGTPAELAAVSTEQSGPLTRRAILTLPREPRQSDGPLVARRESREVVFVSTTDDAEPWVSSMAQERDEDHGRCRSVAYDLSGLHGSTEHIGVAQVDVDDSCRSRGIVPSRIRSYVEGYTERSDKTVTPLDAWAEVMEVFRELEGRLGSQAGTERGASRGDLDDSEQMVVLASELRRRGIDSLLYFDVRCPKSSAMVTVIGTRVGLDEFVGRARSRVTGIDTEHLLEVRSHDSHSLDLREAMEVVLSELLEQPHVRFVDPPTRVERGVHHKLRAVGVESGVGVQLWALRGSNAAAVCAHVDEQNDLSSFDAIDAVRRAATTSGELVVDERTPASTLELELGGLEPGTYVAIATAGATADTIDDEIGHARCVEVVARTFELTVDFAGLQQWTLPRSAPISTHLGFARIGVGVRYLAWRHIELGAQIGYEHVEHTTSYVPTWDGLTLVELSDAGESSLHWQRNGAYMGPFFGVRVPFGRWPWPLCRKGSACEEIKRRRRRNPTLATFFAHAQVMLNIGTANIDTLSTQLAGTRSTSLLQEDLDLALKTGLRVRPHRMTSFGLFGGLLFADVTNAKLANAVEEDFWTNDWGIRGFVGFEMGFGLMGRRS